MFTATTRSAQSRPAGATRHPLPTVRRGLRIGAMAAGALATGALAIGALAIGAVAIGRLAIRRSRIHRLEIDELVVHRLDAGVVRVADRLEVPHPAEAVRSTSPFATVADRA